MPVSSAGGGTRVSSGAPVPKSAWWAARTRVPSARSRATCGSARAAPNVAVRSSRKAAGGDCSPACCSVRRISVFDQLPPLLRQFPDLRPVQRGRSGAQLITEPGQPVGHPWVGPDQLVDHPGRAGGLAQPGDLLGRGPVPGRPGLAGQGGAPLSELLWIRAVQLGGGLAKEIRTAHPVIVPPRPARHPDPAPRSPGPPSPALITYLVQHNRTIRPFRLHFLGDKWCGGAGRRGARALRRA